MKPAQKKVHVEHMCFFYGVSARQACSALQMHRSSFYYCSRKPDQAFLKQRIRDIALSRVNYGYRRIHILLLREGFKINHKRVYRLYTELSLQMRRKKPKRRVQAKARQERGVATCKNDIWSMDFVSDSLFTGKKLRILTVVDVYTRESPVIGVDFKYKGYDVVQTLEQAAIETGYPQSIRIDNGPEFVSKDLDLWAYTYGVALDFSRPGKPTNNAFIESFNSRFRQECLNQHWLLNLDDAKSKIQGWWRDYNSHRPHSSLGYMTPKEFAAQKEGNS